ncbi:MAG: TatD family nuclease-associated radical SAM protein [Clostridia bacterium]|nr:TatD family nuclease-associated radical SAM protein [Clostridia bacterium]
MDTITYEYYGSLYINMTNACPNRCEFCLRNNSDGSIYADDLWYHGPEPTKEVMLEDINKRNLDDYKQVVFCGYGEPTCRLDDLLWLAGKIKEKGNYSVRINTNGMADLIAGRNDSIERMKGLINVLSISLNSDTAEGYDAICHPSFGPQAYDEILNFTKRAVDSGYFDDVVMTVVDSMDPQVIANCKKICDSLGASWRVREYIEK